MAGGFDRAVWDGTKPMVAPAPGARTIGAVALLELGCTVWSASRKDHTEAALGGVIVSIFDKRNEDTGFEERAFLCVDPYSGPALRTHILAETEVDIESLGAPDGGRLRRMVRTIASEIAKGKGSLTTRDIDHIRWIHTLAGVVVPA